jgi:hypothetical protein
MRTVGRVGEDDIEKLAGGLVEVAVDDGVVHTYYFHLTLSKTGDICIQ